MASNMPPISWQKLMRNKRIKLTQQDYKSMELAMRDFKATGLRQQMNEELRLYYKALANRGVK